MSLLTLTISNTGSNSLQGAVYTLATVLSNRTDETLDEAVKMIAEDFTFKLIYDDNIDQIELEKQKEFAKSINLHVQFIQEF